MLQTLSGKCAHVKRLLQGRRTNLGQLLTFQDCDVDGGLDPGHGIDGVAGHPSVAGSGDGAGLLSWPAASHA